MDSLEASRLANQIQAHFGRALRERNWSLFLFFRVLSDSETTASASPHGDDDASKRATNSGAAELDFDELVKIDRAALESNDWSFDALAQIGSESAPPRKFLKFLKKLLGIETAKDETESLESFAQSLNLNPRDLLGEELSLGDKADMCFKKGLLGVCLHEFTRYTQGSATDSDFRGLLRSEASQHDKNSVRPSTASRAGLSNSPVNIGFTYSGLTALKIIDEQVLASFPEAFRQGMAARSKLLRDFGRSAPEYWDGALGKTIIHGLLTAYFPVNERGFEHWDRLRREVDEFNAGCERLREPLARLFRLLGFEALHIEFGQTPYRLIDEADYKIIDWPEQRLEHFGFRDGISQPFVDLGLKSPLPGGGRPAKDGTWAPVAPGEIFLGARDEDGLTADQPINETLRNGATYLVFRKLEQDVAGFRSFLAKQRDAPNAQKRLGAQIVGRWPSGAPLVRHPDADANYRGPKVEKSINDFRYHAEDPHGRKCPIGAHIRRVNPRDTGGRDEVKRHRILRRSMAYGGPLLPDASLGDGRERGLLFVAANSRIELQFEVIQRDWINGGEFLGQVGAGLCPLTGANDGTPDDRFLEAGAIAPVCGVPSFVLNKGGDYFFVPSIDALTRLANGKSFKPDAVPFGPYSASLSDTPTLLSEGRLKKYATEIITSLAPGSDARRVIRVQLPAELRIHATSVADAIKPAVPSVQSTSESEAINLEGEAINFVFLGRYDDVVHALGGYPPEQCAASGQPPARSAFSVAHYLQAGREITRGEDLLIGMDPGGRLDAKRKRRLAIMKSAWEAQAWWTGFAETHASTAKDNQDQSTQANSEENNVVRNYIREVVGHIERRVAPSGQIDLLQDLAFYVPYRLLAKFIGVPGPDRLSELVVALPFAKRYITKLPADWLRGVQAQAALAPDYMTTQMWSRLAFAEVIGNILDKRELTEAAIQATSEMLTHIDEKIREERLKGKNSRPQTLLEALVDQAPLFFDLPHGFGADEYFAEVRAILADLVTTISMNIALPFSKAIQAALAFRLELSKLVPGLDRLPNHLGYNYVELLIYELLRLNPSAPAIFRRCEASVTLPSNVNINPGEWVAALLPAASRDPRFFPKPEKFSLGVHAPPPLRGPPRDPRAYLLFGPPCGIHRCWGERLGRLVLAELFRATARFKGLSRPAGPLGEVVEFPPRMDYGLRLRFPPFDTH